MNVNAQTQAVLLLTVSFGKSDPSAVKPLSVKEWARFAAWLKDHDLDPSALLKDDICGRLAGWSDKAVPVARLEHLVNRGVALGLALEKWHRAGLWVVTRSDPEYPVSLKARLRFESPPVLFGCGERALLGSGGIAVVGSRDADRADIEFTEQFGRQVAAQGYPVVSGGARGVDEAAMLGALGNRGQSIGILANGLLRAATSAKYRKYLLSGNLVLISPFRPEAGFNVGNSMARNKYIYCLAGAAVVVSSTRGQGGTWAGAVENIERHWVPLWVKRNAHVASGNPALVEKGGQWLPDGNVAVETLSQRSLTTGRDHRELAVPAARMESRLSAEDPVGTSGRSNSNMRLDEVHPKRPRVNGRGVGDKRDPAAAEFYTLFLRRMRELTKYDPMAVGDIARCLGLEELQVSTWLRRGLRENCFERITKTNSYQSSDNYHQQALSLDE